MQTEPGSGASVLNAAEVSGVYQVRGVTVQAANGLVREIDGILRLSASNGDTNILSAPHILTSDNEQAEIRVGDNIPIISSRVESAQGQTDGLSSSVNVERQDVGVTLRVTPQITEGDSLRLEIFQEITAISADISAEDIGAAEDVGVPLGVLPDLHPHLGAELRAADRDHTWVVVADALHGPRSEPEDEADHALGRVDAVAPRVEISGERHAGEARKEQAIVRGA